MPSKIQTSEAFARKIDRDFYAGALAADDDQAIVDLETIVRVRDAAIRAESRTPESRTPESLADEALGAAVRKLIEGQRPERWHGPSWEARLTLRKHVLPEFGGYRCHNGDQRSEAAPTLDAAVAAAVAGEVKHG